MIYHTLDKVTYKQLSKAKSKLCMKHAFIGSALLSMKLHVADTTPRGEPMLTSYTNGLEVRVNPHFLSEMTDGNVVYTLAHECLHPMLGHTSGIRTKGRDKNLWSAACDYVVNQLLYEDGIGEQFDWVLRDEQLFYAGGGSAEGIYNILMQLASESKSGESVEGEGEGESDEKGDKEENDNGEPSDTDSGGSDGDNNSNSSYPSDGDGDMGDDANSDGFNSEIGEENAEENTNDSDGGSDRETGEGDGGDSSDEREGGEESKDGSGSNEEGEDERGYDAGDSGPSGTGDECEGGDDSDSDKADGDNDEGGDEGSDSGDSGPDGGEAGKGGDGDRGDEEDGQGDSEGSGDDNDDEFGDDDSGNKFSWEAGKNILDTMESGADSPEEQKQLDKEWDVRTTQATNTARMMGQLSAGLERAVKDALEPNVNWDEVMARFVVKCVSDERSMSRPSRRYIMQGLYLPSRSGEKLGVVVCSFDCSCSIDDIIKDQFASNITKLWEDNKPERLHIIYFDTEVLRHDVFEPGDVLEIKPIGGGGTKFNPVFEYMAENYIVPTACVFLTDLWCDDYGPPPDYPVLWISTDNDKAPFGEVVLIGDYRG